MKKLILAISCAGVLFSCDSNKEGFKSSKNAQRATISSKPKPSADPASVSRLNNNEPIQPSSPVGPDLSHLDSVINGGGTENRPVDYTKPGIIYSGVSGAGSGSSYASVHYAGKKKKPKPAAIVNTVAPIPGEGNGEVIATSDSVTQKTNSTLNW